MSLCQHSWTHIYTPCLKISSCFLYPFAQLAPFPYHVPTFLSLFTNISTNFATKLVQNLNDSLTSPLVILFRELL